MSDEKTNVPDHGVILYDGDFKVAEQRAKLIDDAAERAKSRRKKSREVEFGVIKTVSSFARHDISELEFGGSAFLDFLIKDPSKPLEQHFHAKKFEVFYFLDGGGTVRTAQVNKQGKIVGEILSHKVGRGSVIRIPPYHAHRFDLEPNTRFVAYYSQPFDANDLIPCPIE